jgi:hypothetical protein
MTERAPLALEIGEYSVSRYKRRSRRAPPSSPAFADLCALSGYKSAIASAAAAD